MNTHTTTTDNPVTNASVTAVPWVPRENRVQLTRADDEHISILRRGERMFKVPRMSMSHMRRYHPHVLVFRKFWVSKDMRYLQWESKKKTKKLDEKRVRLEDVESMIRGQQTELFMRNAKQVSAWEDASFSLVCPHRTIDIICEDKMMVETWYRGLQMLVEYNRSRTDREEDERQQQMLEDEHANSVLRRVRSLSQAGMERKDHTASPYHKSGPSMGVSKELVNAINNRHSTSSDSQLRQRSDSSGSRSGSVKRFFAKRTSSMQQVQSPLSSPRGNTKLVSAGSLMKETESNAQQHRNSLRETVPREEGEPRNTNHVTGEDKKLLEFVVMVGLKDNSTSPTINYSFPPMETIDKKKNKKILDSLPLFCFPDIETMKRTTSVESKTYSFVLTDIDGSRRFGYCRRVLPPGKGSRWPISFCIVSAHPCFSLFSDLLNVIEKRAQISNVATFQFIKTVLAQPFPDRGEQISLSMIHPKTGKKESHALKRPAAADPMLEHIDFNFLFKRLSVDQIITLFASVLMERHIVLVSNDISVLSACAHAAIGFIYPFTWQHVFIPALPKMLLDYVCSPVPFVVGVLSIHKQSVLDNDTEPLTIVDLDAHGKRGGSVVGGVDVACLPQGPTKQLHQRLTTITKSRKGKTPLDSKLVAISFVQFMVDLFADYKSFIKPGTIEMDMDKFINSRNKSDRQFFRDLSNSQSFLLWSYEAGAHMTETDDGDHEPNLFERLCSAAQK